MPTVMEKVKTKLRPETLVLWGIVLIYTLTALVCKWQIDRSAFRPGTQLLGVACGTLEPPQAARRLQTAAQEKTLCLRDESGQTLGEFTLAALLGDTDWTAALEIALRAQYRSGTEASLPLPAAAELETRLKTLLRPAGYIPEAPRDAKLVWDEQGPRIQPETPGNIPEPAVCAQALAAYLSAGDFLAPDAPEELVIPGALRRAAVTAQDTGLRRALKTLRHYTDQSLTLELCGGRSHTLTTAEISGVLRVETLPRRTRVSVDREALRALLDGIVEELGADGVEAKYGRVRDTREYVYLVPGDRGFLLDRDKLCEDTAAALENTHRDTVKARYDYTAFLWDRYGSSAYVGTAVEISLDNQYLWFYRDGVLMTETPVTTGCVATYDETRRGSFTITYLDADTYLNGPTWHFHVDYWIPFDGDIGLHDSYWRSDYGADWYLTDGSHGCINTPLDAMRLIFENSYPGMTVIVR